MTLLEIIKGFVIVVTITFCSLVPIFIDSLQSSDLSILENSTINNTAEENFALINAARLIETSDECEDLETLVIILSQLNLAKNGNYQSVNTQIQSVEDYLLESFSIRKLNDSDVVIRKWRLCIDLIVEDLKQNYEMSHLFTAEEVRSFIKALITQTLKMKDI